MDNFVILGANFGKYVSNRKGVSYFIHGHNYAIVEVIFSYLKHR